MEKELKKQLTAMALGVNDFQNKVQDLPKSLVPCRLYTNRRIFRIKFLQEELDEFASSETFTDDIDALIDLVYVAIGALLEMGISPLQMFEPVQAANMAKVRGETKRGEAYDAVKPEGWTPPDHAKVLEELTLRYAVAAPLLEATRIRLERSAKYNNDTNVKLGDHFPLGLASIFQMMHTKHMRMMADITASRQVDRDHPRDLINYAGFMLDFIDGRL